MFYFKQFKTLVDEIKNKFGDVHWIGDSIVTFNLPGGTTEAYVQFVDRGFDEEGDSEGTVILCYDTYKTEFDSLQFAIDAIDALAGHPEETVEEPVNNDAWIDTAMMDHYDMMNGDIGDFESVGNSDKPINEPVMEAATMETEEIVDGPEVIELDETKSVSSDPLVEYLQSLQQFEGWDPASVQVWAMDNRDTIQEYYNQCKDLNKAVQMCFDADSDKFYDDFNKYESVKDAKKAIFTESITKLCEKAGHPEIGETVIQLMEAIEDTECTGDCVQLDDEPNFDVTIAVDTLDPNPAHYLVAGYDSEDALDKVAEDLKTKGHMGYFEENPEHPEDYITAAGMYIPSWLVHIKKIA